MILVWGALRDEPVARVMEVLRARGKPALHVGEAELVRLRYEIECAARMRGWLEFGAGRLPLRDIRGWYVRPAGNRDSGGRASSAVLGALASGLGANVVNRPSAGASNGSKPYQLGLIAAAGLKVPPTLVTTDVVAARAFLRKHGRVVYKSISGVRSIVKALDAGDEPRLETVSAGPVQFQRWVQGRDVRVHVVGDRWFATAVDCPADDYRYAARAGVQAELTPLDIDRDLGERLVSLTRRLGLLVSGVDLRLEPDGAWTCFEVNPSPGFTYYEDATGQPIAEAICDLLARPAASAR